MIMAAHVHVHAVDPWKHESCSRSEQQIHGICRQAADHSNRAYGSTGSGLVAATQQLYKLLYKSCVEAKQNGRSLIPGPNFRNTETLRNETAKIGHGTHYKSTSARAQTIPRIRNLIGHCRYITPYTSPFQKHFPCSSKNNSMVQLGICAVNLCLNQNGYTLKPETVCHCSATVL